MSANLGCCFLARRSVLIELGGYNEIYSPFMWEDTDLGYRMGKKAKICYEPGAVAYHKTASTIPRAAGRARVRYVSTRNKFLFFWLNIRGARPWLGACCRVPGV